MLCNTQDYHVYGLCLSFGILVNRTFRKLDPFPKRYVHSYLLEYRMMGKVQKPVEVSYEHGDEPSGTLKMLVSS
jgi:hypothetical protein